MRIRALLCLVFCLSPFAGAQTATYALRGTLITPQGIVPGGTVLIEAGTIIAAGAQITLPKHVTVVDTHGIIAPGLIDLHNHLTWNIFPRWHPIEEFGSRYDWQQKPIYQELIESPHKAMVADGYECAMERYAEVKALSEGETSVVGSENAPCSAGLAHNLDAQLSGAQSPGTEPAWHVVYNVFPLQAPASEQAQVRAHLASHELAAYLVHIAEGGPHDASAAREFAMLKAQGLLVPGVSLIHAVALTPANFAEMAAHGVGLIWSPRSNLELYGGTANVAAARAAGVTIALAPDWSPTGSDGLLAELNYAATWNEAQSPQPFTDAELVTMATAAPAALIHQEQQLGALAPGFRADLLVLSPETLPAGAASIHDAYWQLTHADATEVALVTVDGAPQYGDAELVAKLGAGHHAQPIQVCGAGKVLVLAGSAGRADASDPGWAQTISALDRALRHHGRTLAPLAECGQ